jgi:alanine racemase
MAEVVRMEGQVLQLREVREQVSVGYGATRQLSPPARIATVDVGYADGYPRALGGCGYAVRAGQRAPLLGRVSMDLLTLDVSAPAHVELAVGDYVELIGGGVPLEEVAALAGTVNYELLTRLSRRAQRIYR